MIHHEFVLKQTPITIRCLFANNQNKYLDCFLVVQVEGMSSSGET